MSKKSARILVVDDRERNIKLVESMLKPQGHQVIPAYDGKQAVELASQEMPDLILLDVVMPEMDGFEVARILREQEKSRGIPILMLTALQGIKDKIKALDAGADDFLSKPFHNIELVARVNSLLRIKHLHDELQTKNALLERILMRYVSEDIAREILSNPDQNLKLGGQSCEVSVLFADIRGFTTFSERREPQEVTRVLNHIFDYLAPLIFEHHGTLDKYLGDAIMAFYGAPVPSLENAAQAVRTAWAMQQQFTQLRQEDTLLQDLGLGIGICTGEAVVGNMGSERIMDYTVIGNTPNTASRLQERAHPGQILINHDAYLSVQEIVQAREIEPLHLKGLSEPVRAYDIIAVQDGP